MYSSSHKCFLQSPRSATSSFYLTGIRKLGLPTLEYRRQRADIIQDIKMAFLKLTRIFLSGNFVHGVTQKLFKERSRLNGWANSFSNRVVNIWNQLLEDVVMAHPAPPPPLHEHFQESIDRNEQTLEQTPI